MKNATRRSKEEIKRDVRRIVAAAESAKSWEEIAEATGLTKAQVLKSMEGHSKYLKRIERFFEANSNQVNSASDSEESNDTVAMNDVVDIRSFIK